MEAYALFYKEIRIGTLFVENGKHRYIPDTNGVRTVCDRAPLLLELREGTDGFIDPIPFFQNRLMNMQRWNLDEIHYQTDWFLLRRIIE